MLWQKKWFLSYSSTALHTLQKKLVQNLLMVGTSRPPCINLCSWYTCFSEIINFVMSNSSCGSLSACFQPPSMHADPNHKASPVWYPPPEVFRWSVQFVCPPWWLPPLLLHWYSYPLDGIPHLWVPQEEEWQCSRCWCSLTGDWWSMLTH